MSARVIGIILIVLAVASFAYEGITYTTRETVVDVGPIHVDSEKEHTIPIKPIVGVAALAGGILLVLVGRQTA